jgi:hypothetical protein
MTRTLVVTCPVPCDDLAMLKVATLDHTVKITGPDGFRRDLELPSEADMAHLEIELFKGIFEVRAHNEAR